jgi:hypothetical protein
MARPIIPQLAFQRLGGFPFVLQDDKRLGEHLGGGKKKKENKKRKNSVLDS